MLALVFAAWLATAPPATPERDIESLVGYACSGGRIIFFRPGSTELEPGFEPLMARYDSVERWVNPNSLIRIESGGDGRGPEFDAGLSRRRSEALRSHLISRGISSDRIHIFVRDRFADGDPQPDDEFFMRQGWIAELISSEESRRLYPPGLVVECF